MLYLDGREQSTMLSDATRASLEAFATQAALAIDSARLYAESAEKARIDRDLRIAAEIQRALLPEPVFENGVRRSRRRVDSVPHGRRRLLRLPRRRRSVGSASRWATWRARGRRRRCCAAAVQSNFVAQAPVSADPADAMARINKALLRRAIEARFATMFYGVVTHRRPV